LIPQNILLFRQKHCLNCGMMHS